MHPRAASSGQASHPSVRRLACVALATAALSTGLAFPATAALPTKGAHYLSNYDDDSSNDVYFAVSRSGRTLKLSDLVVDETPCTNGRSAYVSELLTLPTQLRVASDGSFSGTFAVPQADLEAFTASHEYSLSGVFTRRGKAARVVVRSREVGEGGTVCDSGDRRLTLRRTRRDPFPDQ
jgi:hypothetical protein